MLRFPRGSAFDRMSSWRDERNQKSRARLDRRLSEAFPACVLAHAMRQPFTPPTQRLAVKSYWRHHPFLADRLCRALAAKAGRRRAGMWRLKAQEADLGKDADLGLRFVLLRRPIVSANTPSARAIAASAASRFIGSAGMRTVER